MASKTCKGAAAFNRWRAQNNVSTRSIALELGDTEGGQIPKWANGNRPGLPIRLVARVALRTGLPFDRLADPEQVETARDVFAVLARDAAR